MPYGVDKKIGGDNETNDKWMEKCVSRVKASGKDEGTSIAICKSVLKKTKGKQKVAEFILDKDIILEYNNLIKDE
jgi:hypothetical protein